jgi:hypothetical protein
VLCSVEKPSQRVLSYASEVLLLGGGLLVYSGPVDTMVTYFANIGATVAGVTGCSQFTQAGSDSPTEYGAM